MRCRDLASAALFAVVLGSLLTTGAMALPTVHPKGLTINIAELVMPGHVFYSTDGVAYLLNQEGQVIRSWTSPLEDWELSYVRPLRARGRMLARLSSLTGDEEQVLIEMDWFGNVVWEFRATGMVFHHDHSRLPNGNTLIMCHRQIDDPTISPITLQDDCLIEVTPGGEIVWDWQTVDHFDDFAFDAETLQKISDAGLDWAHGNSASAIPPQTSHADPRFRPGNIIVSYRFINSIAIVDRDTGDIVWRTEDQTIGQHHATMIPDTMVGAGSIMAFDNGWGGHYNNGGSEVTRQFSRIAEIDPNDFSEPWEYKASMSGYPNWWFDSWYISSTQRLANGNTLIDEGAQGRIFEINRAGKIVWEWVNPLVGDQCRGAPACNTIYRAEKVPLTWAPQQP